MRRERWKPVVGFEGLYEVSDRGRVRYLTHTEIVVRWRFGKLDRHTRTRPGRLLNPRMRRRYKEVCLWKDNKPYFRNVHWLVLAAFVGQRPSKKHEGRHLNGNALDNAASNLAWGTRKQNVADSIKHGTWVHGEQHGNAKLTDADVRRIRNATDSQRKIAVKFGVSQSTIWQIKRGNNWRHINA